MNTTNAFNWQEVATAVATMAVVIPALGWIFREKIDTYVDRRVTKKLASVEGRLITADGLAAQVRHLGEAVHRLDQGITHGLDGLSSAVERLREDVSNQNEKFHERINPLRENLARIEGAIGIEGGDRRMHRRRAEDRGDDI